MQKTVLSLVLALTAIAPAPLLAQSGAQKKISFTDRSTELLKTSIHAQWFRSEDYSCQVYVERDGSILALANEDDRDGPAVLTETVTIRKVGKDYLLSEEREKDVFVNGEQFISPSSTVPDIFYARCREAAVRDLPQAVKVRFNTFLGVR